MVAVESVVAVGGVVGGVGRSFDCLGHLGNLGCWNY